MLLIDNIVEILRYSNEIKNKNRENKHCFEKEFKYIDMKSVNSDKFLLK